MKDSVQNDPDLIAYMVDLKTNVLNCYSTVTTGAKDANMQGVLVQAAPEIF